MQLCIVTGFYSCFCGLWTSKIDAAIALGTTRVFKAWKYHSFDGVPTGLFHKFSNVLFGGVIVQTKDSDGKRLFFLALSLVAVAGFFNATFAQALLLGNLVECPLLELGIVLVGTLVTLPALSLGLPVDAVFLIGGNYFASRRFFFCRVGIGFEIVGKGTIVTLGAFSLVLVGKALALSFSLQ